ncbi:MAG: DNA polymerase III subunit beta [Puniceicoccales bacterium]|jgi:DNA polymerase-3 subunit beta|nr:DNA polymerase III subunit beta [Puniceicoccales bacterium]
MKFIIEKDALSAGLQQVMNIVGTKLTMPILANVLIEANTEQNQIIFSTTNLDIGMRCMVTAQVSQSGSITLPAKKFASIVKALPDREVAFELEGDMLVRLSSGGSRFKILGLLANDFPKLPQLNVDQKITINQTQLLRMLKSISYAQSKDENRYILNGVYFLAEDNNIHFIATDGRRLALVSQETADCNVQKNVIVPAKTIAELERTLGVGENVQILMTDKQIAFSIDVESSDTGSICENIYIVSKVVEGKYPNYKQVIPASSDYRIRLDREQLLAVIQRIALVADEKNYPVRLKPADNALEALARSSIYGEAQEKLPIAYDGDTVEIAFNPQFLVDPLKVLANDEVYFEFKNELSPGIIKTNDTFLCVIMPLRIN